MSCNSFLARALKGLVPIEIDPSKDLEHMWTFEDRNLHVAAGGLLNWKPSSFVREICQNFIDGCKSMVKRLSAEGYKVRRLDDHAQTATLWTFTVDHMLLGFVLRIMDSIYAVNFGYVLGPVLLTNNSSDKVEMEIGPRCEGYIGRHGEGLKTGANAFLSYMYKERRQEVNTSLYYLLGDLRISWILRPREAKEARDVKDSVVNVEDVKQQRIWVTVNHANKSQDVSFELPQSFINQRYTAVVIKCLPDDALSLETTFLDFASPLKHVIECRQLYHDDDDSNHAIWMFPPPKNEDEADMANDEIPCYKPLQGFTVLLDPVFDGCFYLRGVLHSKNNPRGFGINVHQPLITSRDRTMDLLLSEIHVRPLLRCLQYSQLDHIHIMDFFLYMMLQPRDSSEITNKDVQPIRTQWYHRYHHHNDSVVDLIGQCLDVKYKSIKDSSQYRLLLQAIYHRYRDVMNMNSNDVLIPPSESSLEDSALNKILKFTGGKKFHVTYRFYRLLYDAGLLKDMTNVSLYSSLMTQAYVRPSAEAARVMNLLIERLDLLCPSEEYGKRIHLLKFELDKIEECLDVNGLKHYFLGQPMTTKEWTHKGKPCRKPGKCNCVVNMLSFSILNDHNLFLDLMNLIDTGNEDISIKNSKQQPEVTLNVQDNNEVSIYKVVCDPDISLNLRAQAKSIDSKLILMLCGNDIQQQLTDNLSDFYSFNFDYRLADHSDQWVIHHNAIYFRLLLPGVPKTILLNLNLNLYEDLDQNYYLEANGQLPSHIQYTVYVHRSYYLDTPVLTKLRIKPTDRPFLPSMKFTTVQDMINYCRDFRMLTEEEELDMKSNSRSTRTPLETLWMAQAGGCTHRSRGFFYFANRSSIQCRLISNSIHEFVEILVPDQGWKFLDLGGSGRGIERNQKSSIKLFSSLIDEQKNAQQEVEMNDEVDHRDNKHEEPVDSENESNSSVIEEIEPTSKKPRKTLCPRDCIGIHEVKIELDCTEYAAFKVSGKIPPVNVYQKAQV